MSSVVPVAYAEIVASIASRSAGPGTRANIDVFTETTAAAIEQVGGAQRGKAIIILNPVSPPMIMRDTVFCAIPADADTALITAAIEKRVAEVQEHVPGYTAIVGWPADKATAEADVTAAAQLRRAARVGILRRL